jgi:hypothetical protein
MTKWRDAMDVRWPRIEAVRMRAQRTIGRVTRKLLGPTLGELHAQAIADGHQMSPWGSVLTPEEDAEAALRDVVEASPRLAKNVQRQ